jgi:uncharacterized protein YaeQ
MALTSTLYNFDITLANVDRNCYETLALRVPMHPSESPEYLTARLFAYCLEYTDGIQFSKGISDPDDPTVSVRDLTGALQMWIEIGAPDAARLHKASKASPKVAVYTHRDPAQLQRQLAGQKIHRAESIPLYAIDQDLIAAFCERLDRRMALAFSVTDGMIYLDVNGDSLSGVVQQLALQPA